MTRPRVLIVEDERPLAGLLAQAFANEGCDVVTAADGIDCMNKIAGSSPDVIVMDIMMPKLDGIDTTRLIRRNPRYGRTVIIALTARDDSETRQRMLDAGADLFVSKPFVISQLMEAVRELLAARSTPRR